jgi:uncharacterized membrane protein YvbJ
MGFKIMKCPACGADLNVETDRDYLFCQFCGAKLMRDDQRIVIEHIERKIDEAKIRQIEFEEKKLTTETFSKKRMWITINVVGILLLIIRLIFNKVDTTGVMPVICLSGALISLGFGNMIMFIEWQNEHSNKK